MSRTIYRVMDADLCTPPTVAEMQQSMELYNEVASLPNVFASVDGTHVKIISPPEDEVAFVNRKNYFSINAMVYICLLY